MGRSLGAIALLAMLVRAIVPQGYMIAAAGEGGARYLTVRLCEAHGYAQRVIDLKDGRMLDPGEKPATGKMGEPVHHAPCVFAAAAPLAPPLASAEPVAFLISHEIVLSAPRDVRPGEGIPAPPPFSTGPPTRF